MKIKVKIPKEIKIGIYPYKIDLVPNLKLNKGSWGTTNHTEKTIVLDSGLPPLELNQTLIHEVVHIISENFRCLLDEDNVERLANGIGELLFDNLNIEFNWDEYCIKGE